MSTQPVTISVSGSTLAEAMNNVRSLLIANGPAPLAPLKPVATRAPKVSAAAVETEDLDAAELDSEELDNVESFDDLNLDDGDEDTEVKAAPKKSAKLTDKDVNVAAMAHARAHGGKAATLKLLTKKFKVKSVLELKPAQYADAIKALKV